LKCEKCGYISFDYNVMCPQCNKDLSAARNKLGIHQEPPEMGFDEFFSGTSGAFRTKDSPSAPESELDLDAMGEAELDLEDMGDEFEFTLDD
jgi:hypothetical protein